MLLFNSYEDIFRFLHDNLPENVKYDFLYTKVGFKHKPKGDPIYDKYGRKEFPSAIFSTLKYNGYAYEIESKEKLNITFKGRKYILLWSRVQSDLSDNIFPSQTLDQFKLISINEACKFLELTRPSVYKLINENEIPVVQIFDKTKRIQMRDLLNFMESKKSKNEK